MLGAMPRNGMKRPRAIFSFPRRAHHGRTNRRFPTAIPSAVVRRNRNVS
jgi:hypothetical protein